MKLHASKTIHLKILMHGSDPKGLYMLDQELAARTYAAPSLTL